MFARIQSTGIGPHADLDIPLSPTGRTLIRGRAVDLVGKRIVADSGFICGPGIDGMMVGP